MNGEQNKRKDSVSSSGSEGPSALERLEEDDHIPEETDMERIERIEEENKRRAEVEETRNVKENGQSSISPEREQNKGKSILGKVFGSGKPR